jgi:hypothetical protein
VQQSIVNWFKDQCLVSESEAEYDIGVSPTRNITASLFYSPRKLHWYEILPITIAVLSGAIFIVIIITNGGL